MPVIKVVEKCKDCEGTGLYIGMAEKGGAAVVCHTCKGTGCREFIHEYEKFTGRIDRTDVKRVYLANPGISIGEGNGYVLEDFGGMSYEEWKQGKEFAPGTENRKCTCPAWWYQTVDYDKKPNWKECSSTWGTSFSQCKNFSTKEMCWKRWDEEYGY